MFTTRTSHLPEAVQGGVKDTAFFCVREWVDIASTVHVYFYPPQLCQKFTQRSYSVASTTFENGQTLVRVAVWPQAGLGTENQLLDYSKLPAILSRFVVRTLPCPLAPGFGTCSPRFLMRAYCDSEDSEQERLAADKVEPAVCADLAAQNIRLHSFNPHACTLQHQHHPNGCGRKTTDARHERHARIE